MCYRGNYDHDIYWLNPANKLKHIPELKESETAVVRHRRGSFHKFVNCDHSHEVTSKTWNLDITLEPQKSHCFMNPFQNSHLELKIEDGNWTKEKEEFLTICSELGRSETQPTHCEKLTFDNSLFSNGEKENRRTISCPISKILWTGASTINTTIKIMPYSIWHQKCYWINQSFALGPTWEKLTFLFNSK